MSEVRLRVLWVTAEAPHHAAWGGPIRQAHLLDALADAAEVDLLVARAVVDPAVRDAVASVTELDVAPARPEAPWVRRVRTVVPSPPVELRVSEPTRRRLVDAMADRAADVVVLQHGEMGALVHERRDLVPGRTVVDLHHLASVRHDHAAATTGGRERALHRVEARRSRRHEQAMAREADVVLVCSPADAARLPGSVVVPNGVTLDALPSPVPAAHRIVFTGHLGYEPNVDAVGWLLGEVLPRVRAEVPDAEVTIVGRSPAREVRRLVAATDGVDLAVDVPDIRPHLDAARVAVVPVRVGSGTRLKGLDAMAAGRPVVGTTIGLEGLGIEDGHHALVADNPAALAAAVGRVLHDDDLACSLAHGGRRLAETFGWDAVGRRFVEAVLA